MLIHFARVVKCFLIATSRLGAYVANWKTSAANLEIPPYSFLAENKNITMTFVAGRYQSRLTANPLALPVVGSTGAEPFPRFNGIDWGAPSAHNHALLGAVA